MFLRKFFIGGFLTLAFALNVFAFAVPAYEDFVTDLANVFPAEQELTLENKITEIEKATTVEIAVLTVGTTGDYDIFDYTYEVASQWGVGKKANDNGLMVVIAVDDRDWFMTTGYGLEGTLPDAIVKRIGENNFPPNFREGNYALGVENALGEIEAYLLKDPTVIANYSSTGVDASTTQGESPLLSLLVVLAVFLIPLKAWWVRKDKKQKLWRSLLTTALFFGVFAIAIHIAVGIMFAVFSLIVDWAESSGSGGSSSGRSSRGGWWSGGSSGGSSGGGSFGGFGGGSFGGGGAGGKW